MMRKHQPIRLSWDSFFSVDSLFSWKIKKIKIYHKQWFWPEGVLSTFCQPFVLQSMGKLLFGVCGISAVVSQKRKNRWTYWKFGISGLNGWNLGAGSFFQELFLRNMSLPMSFLWEESGKTTVNGWPSHRTGSCCSCPVRFQVLVSQWLLKHSLTFLGFPLAKVNLRMSRCHCCREALDGSTGNFEDNLRLKPHFSSFFVVSWNATTPTHIWI